MRPVLPAALPAMVLFAAACRSTGDAPDRADLEQRVESFAVVRLEADLSQLSDGERAALPHLLAAAREMDAIFWHEAYGDREALLRGVDGPAERLCEIHYGPWDRLRDNEPFLPGVGPKPPGANFYPADLTREALERHLERHPEDREAFESQYTLLRRDAEGELVAVPYREAFAERVQAAAAHLERAADQVRGTQLERYLRLRAEALRTDEYRESDRAWLAMRDNGLDVVIGPIETYEDRLWGRKAAHEAYVLVKDREWSRRLERYTAFLPALQRSLPVPEAYRPPEVGTDSELGAYQVVYYAGDCNAGSKTIAVNLPNDEVVQRENGTRRLQLENAMRAKYDEILVPIAELLLAPTQREHVSFDAFFGNTMFHEVAHGLGIKRLVDGSGTVREALGELGGALEEGKADILGLYMVTELTERGELPDAELMSHYVTFLAGIFRSVRFGAASAHGQANMVRFNFFAEQGAFERDPEEGTYRVVPDALRRATEELSRRILVLQGDGDVAGVEQLFATYGGVGPQLQADLARVAEAGIPVDIVFEQGEAVLGL